ncbi:hypothetical protein ACHAPI_008216 [Fusarium lateritium]
MSKPAEHIEPRSENDLLETLGPDDQQAIESFISSLNFPPNKNRGDPPQASVRSESATCTEVLEILRSSSLIDIVFEQLILGPEKTYRGYPVLDCEPKYSLVNLAPGVFHMPYLQNVSDRAQLLPVIATSIARMQHAESPALRQKVTDLRLGNITSADVLNQEVGCVDSIEKSAWEVLLTHLQLPLLTNKRRKKRPAFHDTNRHGSDQEDIIARDEQAVTVVEEGSQEARLYDGRESQENATMKVRWDAMNNHPDITKYGVFNEANLDPDPNLLGAHRDPWTSSAHNLIALGWSQQEPGGPNWLEDDMAMMEPIDDLALEQSYGHRGWINQNENVVSEEGMAGGPVNFQTLDHWLICNNEM